MNDLLKTTEGFQRLKKMNDELKTKTSEEIGYVSGKFKFLLFNFSKSH